jgi:hypothetical protein
VLLSQEPSIRMSAVQPGRTTRPSRGVETLIALLDQRLAATERTNDAMLAEIKGLRGDVDNLWRESIKTYVPNAKCEAACGRRDQELARLGRDVRDELGGIRDGLDERVRVLEGSSSGLKANLPLLVGFLSLLGSVGMAALNLAARTHP